MKKLAFLIFMVILVSIIGCKKENDNPLTGQWQWFKTSAGRIERTPESVDSTYFIEFSKTGNYIVFDNSKKQIDIKRYELGQGDYSNTFKFSESDIFGYKIQNDTLSCWNLFGIITWTNYYKKLK
jgi:hypothetical protein